MRRSKKVAALLKTELAAPTPNPQRLASLYSVQAQAYSILELESKARDAVFKGLKFATDNTDPVRIDVVVAVCGKCLRPGRNRRAPPK